MTIQTLRIQNPNAFLLPELEDLVKRAYEGHSLLPLEMAMEELKHGAAIDDVGLFATREDDKYKAFAHVIAPEGGAPRAASMLHFYCPRAPKVREDLLGTVVNFVRERGYDRMMMADMNRKPRAFARQFEKVGKAKEVGRMYEFDLAES